MDMVIRRRDLKEDFIKTGEHKDGLGLLRKLKLNKNKFGMIRRKNILLLHFGDLNENTLLTIASYLLLRRTEFSTAYTGIEGRIKINIENLNYADFEEIEFIIKNTAY